MKILFLALALLLSAAAVTACGGDDDDDQDEAAEAEGDEAAEDEGEGDGGGGGGEAAVDVVDFQFAPADVSVAVGDTVVWTHGGEAEHTVTADDGAFDSGDLENGDTFEFSFEEAGEFAYTCQYHPEGMTGVVTVTE